MNNPKNLIRAHQTKDRIDTFLKNNNIAKFDNLDFRKYYDEIDGQRYPRDGISINYTKNKYIDQYRDLKVYFCEYIGDTIINPVISCPDIKTKYPIGIIDLRHPPKKYNTQKNPTI